MLKSPDHMGQTRTFQSIFKKPIMYLYLRTKSTNSMLHTRTFYSFPSYTLLFNILCFHNSIVKMNRGDLLCYNCINVISFFQYTTVCCQEDRGVTPMMISEKKKTPPTSPRRQHFLRFPLKPVTHMLSI